MDGAFYYGYYPYLEYISNCGYILVSNKRKNVLRSLQLLINPKQSSRLINCQKQKATIL